MPVRGVVIVLLFAWINTVTSKEKNWTYFVFAQQWAPSVCNDASTKHHKCIGLPKQVKTWTVHGLWPNRGGESIENCNDEWHFNWDKIKSLENQLEASWPNLFNDTKFSSLWKHEWTAHGTCAASLEATNNEFHYFRKVLNLNSVERFNPQKALEMAGITPSCSKAYSIKDIQQALMKYFRLNTPLQIACAKQRHGRTMLMEIHMALSKTFNAIKLPEYGSKSCKPTDQIYIFPIDDMHCSQ